MQLQNATLPFLIFFFIKNILGKENSHPFVKMQHRDAAWRERIMLIKTNSEPDIGVC